MLPVPKAVMKEARGATRGWRSEESENAVVHVKFMLIHQIMIIYDII